MANAIVAAKGGKGGKGGGKGGKGRGGGGGGLSGLAMRQARMQVMAAEQPLEQQIQAERAANLARAQQQMGFAKAAAAIMQNAAPAIGNAYSNAANADAGYSRALGSAVQAPITQNTDQNNAFLAQMGTPQGALHSAAPVGDIAYGLQGYIPATTLQREGAGWESAAQLMPGNLLHEGQQQAGATLGNDPTLVSLQNELGKVAATQPEVANKLLAQYQEQLYKQASLNQGQQRIGIEKFRAQTAAQQGYMRLDQGQARLNLEGRRLQVSIQQAAQRNAQAWARIGISEKNLKLRAAKSQAKLNTGGFTPDELVHIKGDAANMAYLLKNGNPKANAKPVTNYRAALRYMVDRGIPPTIAIAELKHQGYQVPKTSPAVGGGGGFLDQIGKVPLGVGGAVESVAAQKIVGLAHQYLGTPYLWGGGSPKGFDCSGFAQFLYAHAGISIPRTTYTQWQTGRPVNKRNLRPGDLVFFRGSDSRGGLPGHVGVYIGNGMMIDAPHTGASVRVESVFNFGGYMGARRYGNG